MTHYTRICPVCGIDSDVPRIAFDLYKENIELKQRIRFEAIEKNVAILKINELQEELLDRRSNLRPVRRDVLREEGESSSRVTETHIDAP